MRTCDYSTVLWGSAALAGLGRADVGTGELALFRTFHDRRLQAAWEAHRWPDICRTEERTFRQGWSGATTYAAGAEVYDAPTGNYFQSLQAGNVGNAPTIAGAENSAWWAACATGYAALNWLTGSAYAVGNQVRNPSDGRYYQCISAHTAGGSFDGTKFGVLTNFDRYIGFTQSWEANAIGEFFLDGITDRNPKVTTKLQAIPFWISENGAQVGGLPSSCSTRGKVWVQFRLRRPLLTGEAWDSTASYGAGSQVYYLNAAGTVANFYTAATQTINGDSPETAAASWAVVEVPYIFRGYLLEGGYADWLTADGQEDKATKHEGLALGYLELEVDKLQRQGGQVRRFSWKAS